MTTNLTEQQCAVFASLAELVLGRSPMSFADWLTVNAAHEPMLRDAAKLLEAGIALHAGKREADDLRSEIARLSEHHRTFGRKHDELMALLEGYGVAREGFARAEPNSEAAREWDAKSHACRHEISAIVRGEKP